MNEKFNNLLHYAREHSPYYRTLYQGLPECFSLSDLPLVDLVSYWKHTNSLKNWPVLTASIDDGHVFKTGGSSGDGKLSVFTREEWQAFVRAFGRGLAHQLKPGDRVANLFFAGDLYTSLLFIHGALSHAPVPVTELPFTCHVDDSLLTEAIIRYDVNVLAGVPVQLLRFARYLIRIGKSLPGVETLLYGGESIFEEQIDLLRESFPRARIASIGCASVDAGLIGFATPECAQGEHRVFDEESIVEIVDESTHQCINEPGRNGMLVVTNLQRLLMPIIRYPTGDLACWREEPRAYRKFALQGRASQGYRIRIGVLSLFPDTFEPIVQQHGAPLAWQLLIRRDGKQDVLQVLVASRSTIEIGALREAILSSMPALAYACRHKEIRLEVAPIVLDAMYTHPRSGKLMRVVDLRQYEGKALT